MAIDPAILQTPLERLRFVMPHDVAEAISRAHKTRSVKVWAPRTPQKILEKLNGPAREKFLRILGGLQASDVAARKNPVAYVGPDVQAARANPGGDNRTPLCKEHLGDAGGAGPSCRLKRPSEPCGWCREMGAIRRSESGRTKPSGRKNPAASPYDEGFRAGHLDKYHGIGSGAGANAHSSKLHRRGHPGEPRAKESSQEDSIEYGRGYLDGYNGSKKKSK